MGSRRRIGVYNRWWATAGGGEKYAGGIAQALATSHDVTLLGHEPIDREALGARLAVDLSDTDFRIVGESSSDVSVASKDHDVFINVSYASDVVNRAPVGLYVTHFPTSAGETALLSSARRRLASLLGSGHGTAVRSGEGFHPPERLRARQVRWTSGSACFEVRRAESRQITMVIEFARVQPVDVGSIPVRIIDDDTGAQVATTEVSARHSRTDGSISASLEFTVASAATGRPKRFRIESPTFQPATVVGGSDTRLLGVAVLSISVKGNRMASAVSVPGPAFVGSYDRVVANSMFTQTWIRRYWDVESELLHPPVTAKRRSETKDPIILSVGRFFAEDAGHSKKQLEMVAAFSRLQRRGLAGWEYHLVGGCERAHLGYLNEVRNAAAGMPVRIHQDASGDVLSDLYGRASIFWHATGLGEDARRRPERLEHFGITTVEAMSAGVVPVVIDLAGQVETVHHGVNGFRFADVDGLVDYTERLIADPSLRSAMSHEAELASERFGWGEFSRGVQALLDSLIERPEILSRLERRSLERRLIEEMDDQ